jgi:hypothetical protein
LNGKVISNAKYYLIINKKGHLLNSSDGAVDIPDSLGNAYEILLVYKKYHTLIDPLTPGITKLEIYFDNRLKNNLANQKSGGDWFKLKYVFKKKYLVIYGNGRLSINPQSKNDYEKRYGISKSD